MSPSRRFGIGWLLLVFAAGCGGGSAPPRTGQREVILQTEADDRRAGKQASTEVGGAIGILDDPELTAYVNAIGQRLARYAPRGRFDYQFQIVDQDAPNAFALPGGFIYVSRGLLVLTNSEDELAGVIGHEIVHVAARHAAARQSVIRGMPGLVRMLAGNYVAGYSRDQEREADRLGQGLAGLAGYDPMGLADFLRGLEFEERLELGGSRLPSFRDTHPSTSERVAAAASRAQTVAWKRAPAIAANRDDFLRRLDGLLVGMGGSEGVFRGDRFLHPELEFTLRFPPGWDTRNDRQAVGAISRRRDGVIFLEVQGEGEDPRLASERFLAEPEQHGFSAEKVQPLELTGSHAYRVEGRVGSPAGPLRVQITWIAYRGLIYRLTGLSRGAGDYEGAFRNVARSFRPLPAGMRDQVEEKRLRIAPARSGESLTALSERTGNAWDLQQTAVVNGIFADARLESGQLTKVAVPERYVADGQER